MATLDWSVHGPGRPAMPSDGLPLQTALSHLAELATEPWPDGIDHFLSRAGNIPQGDWISSDEAFDAAGDPVQSFHATHGDRVRAMARTMRVPIASVDEITRDEWSAVELASVDYWEIGAGARHVWWALAPMFAKLAAGDDGVVIRVRPIGGGDEVPFGRSFWSKADPETVVRTLASWADSFDPFTAASGLTADDHVLIPSPPRSSLFLYGLAHAAYLGARVTTLDRWSARETRGRARWRPPDRS